MNRFYDRSRFDDPHKDYVYDDDGYPGEFVYGDDLYVDEYYGEELWKPIIGFEGLYWVSDMGRVWSVKSQCFMKLKRMDSHGHLGVCLSKDGRPHYKYIHRLVAEAFIPNPHDHPIVRHFYDIPYYNEADDIDWGTHADNARDCLRNGHAYIWSQEDRQKSIDATRTPIVATNIVSGARFLFRSQGEASRILRIPQANIWKVLNGKRLTAGRYSFEYITREDEENGCY